MTTPYDSNKKVNQLDSKTTAVLADDHLIGDSADNFKAKKITQENLEDSIAESENFSDELLAFGYFIDSLITALINDSDFITQLTESADFQNAVNSFITVAGGSGGGSTKIAVDTTETVIGSSVTTNMFSTPIPAGTLGTNNAFRFKMAFKNLNGDSISFAIFYGGTQIGPSIPIGASFIGSNDSGYIEGMIIANNATNAQKGIISFLHNGDPSLYNAGGNVIYGTATEDSTAVKNLTIVATTGSTGTVTAESIVIDAIGTTFAAPMSFTLPGSNSSTNSLNSYYSDREAFIKFNGTGYVLIVNAATNINWVRDISTDWGSMAPDIPSAILKSNNLYALIRDSGNNFRVYSYDATDDTVAGVLCTFASGSLGTAGGNGVTMTTDGTYFYFSYQGGNSASDNIVSKYSLSGTTFTHISDTTMASGSGYFTKTFLVSVAGNYYGVDPSTGDVKQYSNVGVLVKTYDQASDTANTANIANVFYGCTTATVYLYNKMFVNI